MRNPTLFSKTSTPGTERGFTVRDNYEIILHDFGEKAIERCQQEILIRADLLLHIMEQPIDMGDIFLFISS